MKIEEMNQIIKKYSQQLFVKNDANMTLDHNVAALITAASQMSLAAQEPVISSDQVVEELLDVYNKKDEQMVQDLIGMGPQFVKKNIGYSVDFNDYAAANVAYNAEKDAYSALYKNISLRYHMKEENKSINM